MKKTIMDVVGYASAGVVLLVSGTALVTIMTVYFVHGKIVSYLSNEINNGNDHH